MQEKKESCEAETLSFARVKMSFVFKTSRMCRYKIWHFEEKLFKIIYRSFFHVYEPESTAEAEVASSAISTAAASVPLGKSGFSHASWPSAPPAGLAEVSTALPQTARTWLWVRCTWSLWSSSNQEIVGNH